MVAGVSAAVCVLVALTAWLTAWEAVQVNGKSPASAVVAGQAAALVSAVLSAVSASAPLMWRASDLALTRPWHNRVWVWCASGAAALSLLVALATGGLQAGPVGWLCALIASPLGTLLVTVWARSCSAAAFEKDLRRRRFDFDTKLGMHSPK